MKALVHELISRLADHVEGVIHYLVFSTVVAIAARSEISAAPSAVDLTTAALNIVYSSIEEDIWLRMARKVRDMDHNWGVTRGHRHHVGVVAGFPEQT